MALKPVFFDVGETLVDGERWWRELAERSGLLYPDAVECLAGVRKLGRPSRRPPSVSTTSPRCRKR